ncbi:MAG: ferredoxin reductase [Kineosporiaceae bacterium]|nr:ferredoxin reductase [Kineosporiaceae bacterium]
MAPRVLDGVRTVLAPLARAATTPLLPADYLDLLAPLHPGAHRARVVGVRRETDSAVTVALRPAGRWPGHRAGQHVRVGVEVDGVRCWRSYSLTGPAGLDGTLTITVTGVDDGRVSRHIVERLRVGTVVGLEGPDGDFTLPDPAPAKVLFVTAGSGLTPVMGILRTQLSELPDVVLVHSARTGREVLFADELRAWHAAGRLRLVERHTATSGRLSAADLVELVPDLADRPTWACGPNGLIDTVADLLDQQGRLDQLHTERFRPVLAPVGRGGQVTFGRSGPVVEADGATSLLEAGEASGVLLTSGCRMGICHRCVVPLTEGTVRDLRDGALTSVEQGDPVAVQTCINAAAGPCRVEA